jgi:HPt (histidine-containing phosphotransfer) domain-containing protein
LKEERYCAMPANQQTIQAHMDRQGKDRQDSTFQDLASDGFDPLSLWERVNRDMDLLRDLVELFAEEYPELLLSIKGAIDRGSSVEVQRFSHKLKGSALQFSGKLVAAAAGTLEEMGRTESLEGADKVMATLSLEVLRLMEALRIMIGSERPVM